MKTQQAIINELRAALLCMINLPQGNSEGAVAGRSIATKIAHEAWVHSASIEVKEEVLRIVRDRYPENRCRTYGDAVVAYGRLIVIEAEANLRK